MRGVLSIAAGLCLCPSATSVLAQFAAVPLPLAAPSTVQASEAHSEREYRQDAARWIYAAFPMHIHRGTLPPLMHAIAITETDVDADGQVLDVRLTREPAAAKEVGPWVVAMLRKIGRFPPLAHLSKATYTEVWLVDKSGKFQLDTLTEGQRDQ
jgi:periplasmic protein TonB